MIGATSSQHPVNLVAGCWLGAVSVPASDHRTLGEDAGHRIATHGYIGGPLGHLIGLTGAHDELMAKIGLSRPRLLRP